MKLHHIGYLVDEIKAAEEEMKALGFCPLDEIKEDEIRKIYVLFMQKEELVIELIQPVDQESPIYPLRKRYKNSPYHLCFETADLLTEIDKKCNGGGYFLIEEPRKAPAIAGAPRIAFLMSSQIGMIELIEGGEETC